MNDNEYEVTTILETINGMIYDTDWSVLMPHPDAAMWMMELKALLIRGAKKCDKILVEVRK